jgi:hypothetical protein
MKIPAPSRALLLGAAGVSLFVIASRFMTVVPVLHRLRQGHRVSLLPAINLSQMSEFSLVILVLGLKAGHIGGATLDMMAYAFAIMAVVSSYGIGRSDTLVRRIGPLLTRLGVRDLDNADDQAPDEETPSRIMLLGFFTTASSLLAEMERHHPEWLKDLTVVDFNPVVNEKLRERGVRVIYGDVSQRETLHHAGVGRAEIVVCTLPDTILKGTSNQILVRQIRELNPSARIIATSDSLDSVRQLYAAGADYVNVPRVTAAAELRSVLAGVLAGALQKTRIEQDARLARRNEILS